MTSPPFKIALVTGATSGIGEALCTLLASKGINLIITGRNREKLKILSETLSSEVNVTPLAVDLMIPSERREVITAIQKEIPDLVINNAGQGLYGDILLHPTQKNLDVLTLNANIPLEITIEAAKALHANKKKGVILNVASAAAFFLFPSFTVYSAAKDFLVHCSQSLDYELTPYGIRILVSCPGMVETRFAETASLGKFQNAQKLTMGAETAAKEIWMQIEKKKRCHIFDWKTRWGTYLSRLLPNAVLAKILRNSISNRY